MVLILCKLVFDQFCLCLENLHSPLHRELIMRNFNISCRNNRLKLKVGVFFANMDQPYSEYAWVITSIIHGGMKLFIHPHTSTMQPLKIGNGWIISPTFYWACDYLKFIHASVSTHLKTQHIMYNQVVFHTVAVFVIKCIQTPLVCSYLPKRNNTASKENMTSLHLAALCPINMPTVVSYFG